MTTAPTAASALPYGRQCLDEDDVAAVVAVLRGDWLTGGPAVQAFESALSRRLDDTPIAAISSGTAALHASYAAAGLEPGSELVTTPMTFAATASAALLLGARVRFADVSDDTLCLDPAAAAAACTPRTRVIAAVDYAGHPADHDALLRVAHSHGALLVDDAAHAIGSSIGDRKIGTVADMTTFSFHPVKTVTTGEGGAVASAQPELVDAVRRFRNHGLTRERSAFRRQDEGAWHQEVQTLGLNYRMSDLSAALGVSQLAKLADFVRRRRRLVDRYGAHLADVPGLRLPAQRQGVSCAWHLYTVRVLGGRRREVFDGLRAAGIGVQVHYLPLHLQPLFADAGYGEGAFPVAEQAYQELISLPLHPSLSEAEQDRVIANIRQLLA
jgi:perosamine synthetase